MDAELEAYVEAHIEAQPDNLARLERESNVRRVNGRMCSGHVQGRLLKMLTRMVNPRRALELGTFTGYSALCIAEGLAEGATLITVEKDDELEETILRAFAESEFGNRVSLIIGDAEEECRKFPDGHFDLIFIDADKRRYPEYYHQAKRLIPPGGYIIADNILWDGHVAEEERHDRQTEGVKEFNRLAGSDSDMETVILPVRDGISIIRKRK